MPAFPMYQQQTSAGGAMQPSAPSPVMNSNAVGDGLQRLAGGLQDAASGLQYEQRANEMEARRVAALKKHEDDENGRAWAGNAVPDLAVKFDTLFKDSQLTAKGAATGFTKDFLSKFSDTAAATIAMAPDEPSKKYLTSHLNSMKASYGTQAVAFEAQATKSWRISQSQDGADKSAILVARDPKQFDTQWAIAQQTAPDVGPVESEKLKDETRRKLIGAAAGTSVERDAAGTFAAINTALNIKAPAQPNPFKVAQSVAAEPAPVQKIVAAIYGQESGSGAADTSQPNYAGARGPMQVTEATFDGLKKQGLIPKDAKWDNPEDSAAAGVALIRSLWSKYDGDPKKVFAAYYAGEKAVNADGTINTEYRDLKNAKAPTVGQYIQQASARMGLGGATTAPLMPLQPVELNPGDTPTKTGIGWIDNATPAELLHYRQQSFTEMGRNGAVAKNGIQRTEQDLQAMALQGVVPKPEHIPTQDQYVAAFGPVEGVIRYKENVTNTVALGQSIAVMQTATPEQRALLIAQATPVEGPGFADAQEKRARLQQANAIVEKQLKDDPAIYVSKNSPRVKAAFDALRGLPPGATPEEQRAAVDRYAGESIAEQTRLGAARPQLLTDDQASKIALSFTTQKEGGDNAAKLIEGLQKQWGSYFPVVFQQLQKDDKLPGDAMVIPNMKDAASKERLARLAVVPDKDMKLRLQPGDEKDLKSALTSVMEPFWNTLAVQGGGQRTYGFVERATERLAMSYMTGGKSASDAAKQAFDETAGHGYTFEKTYRIPKAEMPDQVQQGVQALKYRVEELPFRVPANAPGFSSEGMREQYADALKAGATFVTNGDESGVLLYINGRNGMEKVMGPNGQMSFTWKQLRDESAAAGKIKAVQVGSR